MRSSRSRNLNIYPGIPITTSTLILLYQCMWILKSVIVTVWVLIWVCSCRESRASFRSPTLCTRACACELNLTKLQNWLLIELWLCASRLRASVCVKSDQPQPPSPRWSQKLLLVSLLSHKVTPVTDSSCLLVTVSVISVAVCLVFPESW